MEYSGAWREEGDADSTRLLANGQARRVSTVWLLHCSVKRKL